MDVQLTFTDVIVDIDKFIWTKMSWTTVNCSFILVIYRTALNYFNNIQKYWNSIKWPNGIAGIFQNQTLRLNLNSNLNLKLKILTLKIKRIGIKSNDPMELRGT